MPTTRRALRLSCPSLSSHCGGYSSRGGGVQGAHLPAPCRHQGAPGEATNRRRRQRNASRAGLRRDCGLSAGGPLATSGRVFEEGRPIGRGTPELCPAAGRSETDLSPWAATSPTALPSPTMVYPGNFLRLVVEGAGYTGERWSWGLSMGTPAGLSLSGASPSVPAGIVAAVRKYHAVAGVVSPSAKLDLIKFNYIGADGRYVFESESVREEITPPVPGNGAGTPPPQLAICCTLRTAKARGRGSRGRFYSPYPTGAGSVGAVDGRLAANIAKIYADAAATLINDLNAVDVNDSPAAGMRVIVASDAGPGAFEPVTAVEVGRVVDTMRSRRSSLDEDYQPGLAIAGAST